MQPLLYALLPKAVVIYLSRGRRGPSIAAQLVFR